MHSLIIQDPPQDVALKCFTKGSDESEITLEDLSQTYADVRSEFNKLVSIDHPHIVKCIGFCVISLSFVLELAPHGNLKSIIKNYKRTGYFICPRSLVDAVNQVGSIELNQCLIILNSQSFATGSLFIKPFDYLVTIYWESFMEENIREFHGF